MVCLMVAPFAKPLQNNELDGLPANATTTTTFTQLYLYRYYIILMLYINWGVHTMKCAQPKWKSCFTYRKHKISRRFAYTLYNNKMFICGHGFFFFFFGYLHCLASSCRCHSWRWRWSILCAPYHIHSTRSIWIRHTAMNYLCNHAVWPVIFDGISIWHRARTDHIPTRHVDTNPYNCIWLHRDSIPMPIMDSLVGCK